MDEQLDDIVSSIENDLVTSQSSSSASRLVNISSVSNNPPIRVAKPAELQTSVSTAFCTRT